MRPPGGDAAYEYFRVEVVISHTNTVAEDRAAAEWACGVNCQHTDAPAILPRYVNEAVNDGALSCAGRAGYTHDLSVSSAWMGEPHHMAQG